MVGLDGDSVRLFLDLFSYDRVLYSLGKAPTRFFYKRGGVMPFFIRFFQAFFAFGFVSLGSFT